jgi:hypothetical protein
MYSGRSFEFFFNYFICRNNIIMPLRGYHWRSSTRSSVDHVMELVRETQAQLCRLYSELNTVHIEILEQEAQEEVKEAVKPPPKRKTARKADEEADDAEPKPKPPPKRRVSRKKTEEDPPPPEDPNI